MASMTLQNDLIHDPDGGMARLLEIMRALRDPATGCPWDIEQTFETIAPYTIEEAYEVADAIERGAMDELRGELGDLLLQVVYHAAIGEEKGAFDFNAIAQGISDKMVARHPHVFGDAARDKTVEDQSRDWETAKAAERAKKSETRTLDGVAFGLPALTRALKLQKRLARVGFDWGQEDPILDIVSEEIRELAEAREISSDATEDEFGDLLFVLVNLARHWGVDPEAALRRTNAKVAKRFAWVEDRLAEAGRTPADSDLAEMDALWEAAKKDDRR